MSSIVDAAKQLGDQIVKRKQKKINTFVSMLEDPDLQELVSALRNGHTASVFAAPKHKFSGGLSAAIVALRSELTKQFSAPEVQRRLEEHSFQFNSGDHRSAVRDALFRLVDTKQIKLVVKGKGGQPSVFEWP